MRNEDFGGVAAATRPGLWACAASVVVLDTRAVVLGASVSPKLAETRSEGMATVRFHL